MAYIGNEPAARFTSIPTVQQFNGDGSTVAFTLSRPVGTDQDLLVSVDGVIQDTAAYAVSSGTTLTFSAAPSTGTANIFVNYLGVTIGSVVHPASSALAATTGTFNNAVTITTADGVADNAYALTVKNEEATDDRSFGVLIQAGSTATDFVLRCVDHNFANDLFKVGGDGISVARHGVTLTAGNLKVAAGNGIDFSATANSSGSMSSELLDDYEEGTWTPAVNTLSGTSGALTAAAGTYTKVGNVVTLASRILFGNAGGAIADGDSFNITGFPFSVAQIAGGSGVALFDNSVVKGIASNGGIRRAQIDGVFTAVTTANVVVSNTSSGTNRNATPIAINFSYRSA